jgi:lipoprotein-anchoring transpeptidase ErfK/SrfK
VRLRATPGGRTLARLGTRTEFGSPKVLGVRRRRGAWLQVIAPELRNGRYGWIPARVARLGATDIVIRVDRSAHRLTVSRGRHVLRRFPVAVGRPGNPTPLGRFAITDRLRTHRADSPYGCCALALSGHQPRLPPGWPGGDRIAVHATPATATIGHSASLGCLRARTADVRALMRLVPLGTPVFVDR